MILLFNYDMFPYWMGITGFGTLIAAIFCFILILTLYILIGGIICSNDVTNKVLRIIFILFWPLFICLGFLLFPIWLLYEFSKPAKQQEAELNEFIRKIKL